MLRPVLFLVFNNDIDCGISNWILKFDDDTKVFSEIKCAEDSQQLQKKTSTIFLHGIGIGRCHSMLINARSCILG